MLSPETAYELCYVAVNAVRAMMRCSTPIAEPTSSFLFVSREPFVADATTDSVSSTQLGHREPVAQSIGNELNSLFHR
jgi:hypothetical protein